MLLAANGSSGWRVFLTDAKPYWRQIWLVPSDSAKCQICYVNVYRDFLGYVWPAASTLTDWHTSTYKMLPGDLGEEITVQQLWEMLLKTSVEHACRRQIQTLLCESVYKHPCDV